MRSFLLGAKTEVKDVPTARDYVQDGLVAMWDGIENAGWGVHDDTATVWTDLVGDHDMTFVGTHEIRSKSVYVDGVANAYGSISGLTWGPISSQEFVLCVSSIQSYGRVIGEQRGLCVSTNPGVNGFRHGRCYGFGIDAPVENLTDVYFGANHTVGLMYDGNHLSYHVDGEFRGTRSQTFSSQFSGQTTFFNRASGGRGITGEIFNIRLYSRALTAAEIAANYAIDSRRFGL